MCCLKWVYSREEVLYNSLFVDIIVRSLEAVVIVDNLLWYDH